MARNAVAEPKSIRYRDAVARWLRASMRDALGRDKMNISELCKRAKIGRSSFYRIFSGEADAEPETLLRLAAALKVPAPDADRVLRLDPQAVDVAAEYSPLAKLKEARALMDEVIAGLEFAMPDAGAAAKVHRAVDAGVHPVRRPRGHTG